MKIFVSAIALISSVLLVSGCSSSSQAAAPSPTVPSTWTEKAPKGITDAEFQVALSSQKKNVDEFKGNIEIYPRDLKTLIVTSHGSSLLLSTDITKADKKSPYEIIVLSRYGGQDWLFFDSYDVKSTTGVFSYSIDSLSRNDQTQDDGSVSETAGDAYTVKEATSFCHVMSGSNVQIRFNGNQSSITEITKSMPDETRTILMNGCVVYFGLLQGLPLN